MGHSEKLLYMRLFLIVLVLIFGIKSFSKADDIREFEIEGITLYESALSHFSTSELQEDTVKNYTSNKYTTSNIYDGLKMYDYIQVSYKTNDRKYIIQDISAAKNMKYKECISQLDKVKNDISSIYENSSKIVNDGKLTYDHPVDKSGQSKITDIAWYFDDGHVIVAQCYNWQSEYGKKNNFKDSLTIAISNKDIDRWFSKEAYN
tara:strand:+ start:2227 stop:2841 length:615 start_codon:yes stop_codon:yes gene_type:complete